MEALHLQQQSGRIVIDVVIIWHSLTTPKKAMALHFASKEEVTDLSRHISFWRNMLIKFCHFDCLPTSAPDLRMRVDGVCQPNDVKFGYFIIYWRNETYLITLLTFLFRVKDILTSICDLPFAHFSHSIAHQSHEYPDMLQDKTDYSLCSYDQRVLFSIASSSAFLHWMMLSPKGYLLIYYNPVYSFVVIYSSRYIRRIIRRL